MTQVSCLMVTLGTPARLPMLARAIADHAAQTHAARDLVIVIDRSSAAKRAAVQALADSCGQSEIRIIEDATALSLGALRNRSVGAARGDIVCQWDDDDRHHPRRIERQLAALEATAGDAVVLQEVMLLRAAEARLRWTNWAATPGRAHPATLLCRRAAMPLYPEAGPTAALGEDLAVLRALDAGGRVHRLAALPFLYVYVAHGANSWPATHHAMLADTLAISAGLLRRREPALRDGLAPLGLPPGMVVEGPNGLAFRL